MVHGKCCSDARAFGPGGEAVVSGGAQVEADGTREIDSRALFGEERTLAIRHGSGTYTLRITRADKLILTK